MRRLFRISSILLITFIGILSANIEIGSATDSKASKQRFLANGDGTITDQTNNLVWQAEDDSKKRNWSEADSYCRNLKLSNKTNWRLPTEDELTSLVDQERSPTIDTNYFKLHGMRYWTSTPYNANPSWRSFVFFTTGVTAVAAKEVEFLVRCVSNGNGNEQVFDKESGYTQWTTSTKLSSILQEMRDNRMFPSIIEGREVSGRYSGKVLQYRAKFIPFLPDMISFKSEWGIVDRWYKHYSDQYVEEGYTEHSHTTYVDQFGAILHQATWVLIYKEREHKEDQNKSSNGNLNL
jgi:hypothetical protein